ncbi:unnamed protein product [Ilex paraguariensis]|uniref:Pectinesterase inhibitor domain-containing protein n=1 Tax=Ilex paraguariensis TaxID=185542 RepID=A0ABC8V2U0_9AQUA
MGYSDGSGKKKVTIIGLSSVLLVAMVVAVAVGINNKNAGAPAGGSTGNGEISTSNKAVTAICQSTDYKETCINSLSSAKNTTDPKELIKLAFQVTYHPLEIRAQGVSKTLHKERTPRAYDGSGKKKVTIIGLSSVLLVAMVVAVAVGINNKNAGAPAGGSTGNGEISTSNKAVTAICQSTDYKETCINSLSSAKNTTDPKELIKLAFQVTINHIGDAIKSSSVLKEAAKDPRTSQAFETCKELLDTSIDDLKRSFDKVSEFDASKMDDYVADLKVWLSGSITYQETCLDGFENTTGDSGEKMRKLLKTSAELSSNGLAMVSELSQLLSSLQIPGLNRRLLSDDSDNDYPSWVNSGNKKMLLQATINYRHQLS